MNNKKTASTNRLASLKTLIVGLITIVSLLASAGVIFKIDWLHLISDADTAVIKQEATKVDSKDVVITAIEQETAKLLTKPRTVVLTSEKALATKAAIKRGDYAEAKKISTEILASSKLQHWRFYPFTVFMDNISSGRDDVLLENLNKWLTQDKDSALAYQMRAKYYDDVGWEMRGNAYASKVQNNHLNSFQDYVKLATEDALKAVQLNADNPYGYYLLLKIISAHGDSNIMESTFQAAIKKFPTYYPLYRSRLNTLSPKWGGSIEAMYAFTDRYIDKVADNSPLKLLYVQLYANLLNTTQGLCYSIEGEDKKKCVTRVMDKIVTPTLANQVYIALDLYNKTDPHQFNLALKPILIDMLKIPSGKQYSGNILQLAADRMGSQNQLVDNNVGHNNYMLDEITGNTWYESGYFDNAEKKYGEALLDIEHAPFPNEEEKAVAVAGIYEDFSQLYNKMPQFVNVIVYQNAAIAMGGKDPLSLKCHAYYKLKLYTEAVQECSNHLDSYADIESRFWRGLSYEELGQMDAALQDLSVIADSEDGRRISSAIEMTVIYSHRNELENMMIVFNKYPYLFDEEDQSKYNQDNLAVSFNNRCFAYMGLGQLQKALDDCTTSLKYGSLPDAYQKQQELIKKLTPAK